MTMSLQQRLSKLHDIVHKKRRVPDEDPWSIVKRRRILTETMAPMRMTTVYRTTCTVKAEDTATGTATDTDTGTSEKEKTHEANETEMTDETTKETNIEKKETRVADKIVQDYVKYLQHQSDLVDQDNQRLQDKRNETLQTHTKVWKTYLHGLSTISQLTDLRHAPDAIMPNNFS